MKLTDNGIILGPIEYRVLFDLGSRKLQKMGFQGKTSVNLEADHVDVAAPEVGGRAIITYAELERETKRTKRNPVRLLRLLVR